MTIFAHYLTTITMKFSTGFQQLTLQSVDNSVYLKGLIKHMYVLFTLPLFDSS